MAFFDVDNYHGPSGSSGPGRWVVEQPSKPWTAAMRCVIVASNGTFRCQGNGDLAAYPPEELSLWATRIAGGGWRGKKGWIALDARNGYRTEIRIVVEGGGRYRPEVLPVEAVITASGAVLEDGTLPVGVPENVRVYVRKFPHYISKDSKFQLPLATAPQDGDVISFPG